MLLSFTHPEFLVLLPICGAVLWWSARVSYADLPGVRRGLAWVARGTLMAALVLAISGTRFMKPARNQLVVFAVDQSASVPPAERERALQFVRQALPGRRPQDRGALVVFGREALVDSEHLMQAGDVQVSSNPAGTHTDLAAALRLSSGLISAESAGRIVLLSDGNENMGDALTEVLVTRAGGVSIDVLPLKTQRGSDLVVHDLQTPAHAKRGEPFESQVRVTATQPMQGMLRLLVDDQPFSSRSVTVAAGTSVLRLPVRLDQPGFHKLEVQVGVPGELCPENNRALGFVRVRGKPRVLLVDQHPEEMGLLKRALAAHDIDLEVGGAASLPISGTDLEQYDCLLLSDFPAYAMSQQQMLMIRDAVRDLGIGLGMIGGEYSFGAGGYFDSPVEEALPVDMDLLKDRNYMQASVILVIDTSGSMAMQEDGYQKIELAAEAACSVVDLLQPVDAVGCLASDPAPTLVSPIRRLTDKNRIKNDIRSLRAGGGGIAVFPSLRAAYGELSKEKSPVRHIILLADGSDCDEQPGSVDLVRQMMQERITVTAIAFGDGPHVPFLKDVAAAGQGQFYLTDRARDLKGIFTREAMTIAKSVVVEETFRPRLSMDSPILGGIDTAGMPPLRGYVAATPKDRATLPLLTHKQDPLLAHWQYGLGRSIAFTSDAKAHWALQWVAWPEFPRFWAQALRWCLRQIPPEVIHPRFELMGDKARLIVEAVQEDGTVLNGLEMTARVRAPDGAREQVTLTQNGPGRYEAEVPAHAIGSYLCSISAGMGESFTAHETAGFALAYPPDLADARPDEGLLRSLAEQSGGQVLKDPAQAFRPPVRVPRLPVDISRLLLWLAAILLPLDVAVRRLALRREDFAFLTAWLSRLAWAGRAAARLPRRPRTEAATVSALLDHKQQGRRYAQMPISPEVSTPSEPAVAPPVRPLTDRDRPESAPPPPVPEESPATGEHSTSKLLELKRRRRERY